MYRRPMVQVLEDRISPATINWINLAGGNWATASNWSSSPALPGPGDDVVIPALNSGASVTHSTGTDTVNSVTASAAHYVVGGDSRHNRWFQ